MISKERSSGQVHFARKPNSAAAFRNLQLYVAAFLLLVVPQKMPLPATIARPALNEPPVGAKAPSRTLPGVVPSAPPRLLNWDYVTRRILTEYRPDERHRGSIVLRIWVDEEGRAGDASIVDSDGDPALARVALASVPLMRFAPAESRLSPPCSAAWPRQTRRTRPSRWAGREPPESESG